MPYMNTDKLTKKLKTKEGMLQAALLSTFIVATTTIGLFFYHIRKNRKATLPLGYKKIDKSKIPPIKDRSGDIIKDRYHPSRTKLPKNVDYIVIGSGIGGLSTAALLSRVGRRVLVLEQHDRLGGCLHQYSKAYQFDTGIHYIGKPGKYGKMLAPITSKPIQFVAMGNKQNGYCFDEYILGKNENMKTFRARANTRKQDLLKQFNTEQDKKAIEEFYALAKDADKLMFFLMGSKLFSSKWVARLFVKYGKWKYPHLWNKSVADIRKTLFSHNHLLGMTIFSLIGDFGGKMCNNAMTAVCGLFSHYSKGGYFINGGPAEIARSIIPVIEQSGGRCLANVEVQSIIFENNRACGVIAKAKKGNKTIEFRCKYGVVSSAGFRNTYTKLAPVDSLPKTVPTDTKLQIQRLLNSVEPSVQHFHIFIGFNKTANELNFPQNNRWYFEFENKENEEYNYDELVDIWCRDPLNAPSMGFLSFPSAKNPSFEFERPGKATAVILTEIPYYHFKKWENGKHDARGKDYNDLKKQIADKLIEELLYKYYPQTRGEITKIDIGTALSAQYYLGSSIGESYGLCHSMNRYFDFEINQLLKAKQPIKGLWLSGQDLLCAGFASALQGGVWCAESILGYHKFSVLASGRSLIKDLNKMDKFVNKRKSVEDYDFDQIKQQTSELG
eukprot:241138_1